MPDDFALTCPLPIAHRKTIVMGHGSGGRLTAQLVHDLFLPAFDNQFLRKLDDQAVLDLGGARIAFTTDSFVVTPLFFPGGDIGKLARGSFCHTLDPPDARSLTWQNCSWKAPNWCFTYRVRRRPRQFTATFVCRCRRFAASRCSTMPTAGPGSGSASRSGCASPASPLWPLSAAMARRCSSQSMAIRPAA